MAHYEVAMFIGGMYFADRVGAIFLPQPLDKLFAPVVVLVLVVIIFIFRWRTDSFRSVEKRLEEDALKEGVEEITAG